MVLSLFRELFSTLYYSPVSTSLQSVSLQYYFSPGVSTELGRKEDLSEYLLKDHKND